jgi:hypothetical protein
MHNKPYNKNKMKTRKAFDINRLREFCRLVNEGQTPVEALANLNTCIAYATPLKTAGLYWKEKDGTFKAVERIRAERYDLFLAERKKYNKTNWDRQVQKQRQTNLFTQPKPKQPIVQKVKAKQPQLNFIQRVVKSLFNL